MYQTVLFVHVIAAMVYFGLPFTFGRWLRTSAHHPETFKLAVNRIKLLTQVHLNVTGILALATGIVLAVQLGLFKTEKWPHAAPILTLITLANLNFVLVPALKKALNLEPQAAMEVMRGKLALFSASQHTLVTLLVALMIFKPF
jgi:hypothetical protein